MSAILENERESLKEFKGTDRGRETRFHILSPVRAVVRLCILISWTCGCYLVLRGTQPIEKRRPALGRELKRAVAYFWIRRFYRIVGTRVIVRGTPPKAPFFLVGNHISWIDFFAVPPIIGEATLVVEDPIRILPLIGPLVAGLEPIFVRRVREDTARVLNLMTQAVRIGQSVVIAPETPMDPMRPGSGVRMFRAGLLESAVATQKPVSYFSLTYRTPDGYARPSHALVYGPSPFYRAKDGTYHEAELQAFGEEKSFFKHFMGVLGMPWHEFTITFGSEPIWAPDRITLANRLHQAVVQTFKPLE